MSAAFDALTYANKLREAGFAEQQAQAQADALRAAVMSTCCCRYRMR